MHARASQPFVLSVLVHAVLAGLILWLMFRPEARPFIIELAPGGFQTQSAPIERAQTSAASPVKFTPVAPPVRVRETAASAPVEELSPPVERVAPRPPTVMRTQNQTRAATPTTITEYRNKHPLPAQSTSTAPRSQTAAPTRINLDEVLADANPRSGPATLNDNASEQASYFGRLLGRLRGAHENPAGLTDELQAQVEFLLRADGSVADVRILRSSGSEAFDASVLAAFRRLRDLEAPPKGAAGVNKVLFRTRAD